MKLPGLDTLGPLKRMGLVGERKAVALLCIGFYTSLFGLIALSARTELPEWMPVFVGMTLVYATAFMGVGAEWFWGRWFATGVGYWGVTIAVMAFVTTRTLPSPMMVFGVMHLLVIVCLTGEKMAGLFDAKPGWRERWKLDEQGVVRVRRSVTRAASSLPALIMFALAPRESAAVGAALGVVALVGLGGLLACRTWGLVALGAAGVMSLAAAVGLPTVALDAQALNLFDAAAPVVAAPGLFAAFAGAMLLAAVAPFARPMLGFLRQRNS
jgi:hypothetical protein